MRMVDVASSPHVSYAFEDLELGMSASFTQVIERSDIDAFAKLCGDYNPVHVDPAYAATTLFKDCIAHGILTGSLISTVFGMKLPGAGAIYVSQTFNFRAPVYAGDRITAHVEVMELYPAKSRVKFKCWCTNQSGRDVLLGEAILMVPLRNATS
ncbi:MAG: MaoC family dehydratase [Hyphomicrobiaceae bacterium]